MPTRIFAITAARETVSLDNQGRAGVSFTASNTGPKPMAGQAKLISIGSTKEAWLSLEGEHERKFAKGEAQQFTVKVAVPPGTPVGKYSFRLNIISVENPDDEFTEGPSVSFEVKELAPAAVAPRKFPWWIVAVAGVLVLGGGLITWLLMPEKVKVPNMVGMPFEEAVNSLNTAKLKLAKETKDTGTQKPGIVIEQSPKAKEDVSAGSEVKLTIEGVSVRVPDLTEKTVAQAWVQLNDLNLVPKYRDGEAARVSALLNKVRWQSPEAGVLVAPGTTVTYSAAP